MYEGSARDSAELWEFGVRLHPGHVARLATRAVEEIGQLRSTTQNGPRIASYVRYVYGISCGTSYKELQLQYCVSALIDLSLDLIPRVYQPSNGIIQAKPP